MENNTIKNAINGADSNFLLKRSLPLDLMEDQVFYPDDYMMKFHMQPLCNIKTKLLILLINYMDVIVGEKVILLLKSISLINFISILKIKKSSKSYTDFSIKTAYAIEIKHPDTLVKIWIASDVEELIFQEFIFRNEFNTDIYEHK